MRRVKHVDDCNLAPAHTLDDSIGSLDELTNAWTSVPFHDTAKVRKVRELVPTPQDSVNCLVRGAVRIACDAAMDVGERS